MTVSSVQEKLSAAPASSPSSTTVAATYDSAVTSGNLLWCYVTWSSINSQPSCSDSVNGAWTAGPWTYDTINLQGTAFFFKNNTGSGTPTVTATFGGSTIWRGIHIFEVSGQDTTTQPDVTGAIQTQASPGTGTDAVTSGAVTTVTNGAMVVGASINTSAGTQPSAGTGFTALSGWASGVGSRAEYLIKGTAGSQAATFTTSAGTDRHTTGVMVFRPAAGAGGFVPRATLLGVG